MDDWEVVEKFPSSIYYCDFLVEFMGQIRKVYRDSIDYRGTLIFTDCTHPLQNIICDESKITAWKIQC